MGLLSAPKATQQNTSRAAAPASAPPAEDTSRGRQRQQPRVNVRDPLAAMDDFEYGEGKPEKLYQHLGEHIARVQQVAQGESEETGAIYFGVTAEIVESTVLPKGTLVRDTKTLDKKISTYFLKFIAERTSAIFRSMGDEVAPGDVRKWHAAMLTGGRATGPDGVEKDFEPVDFEANRCFVRFVVKSEPRKDQSGKLTGAFHNQVYIYPLSAAEVAQIDQ